jgi:hypothetical protein
MEKQSQYQEIAETRKNFYLEKDDKGNWISEKIYSTICFACQNILMLYKYKNMDLIIHNSSKADNILVLGVSLDLESFNER